MAIIGKNIQRQKLGINLVVLCVCFVGLMGDKGLTRKTSAFENLMVDSFAPVQKSVVFLRNSLTSFFSNYLLNVTASKDNVVLKRKVLDLENKLFQMEQLAKENRRLKSFLEFGRDIKEKKILAQIVAWDTSSDFKAIRVNKGLKQGIRLQSTVVTADGLVGYVYRITDHFADILTVLDSNNKIDGMVERTRSHGIVEGLSKDYCVMKYVTRTEPIILNDLVITSGLGNIYPKGIKLGRVVKIERESYGITQHVEIRPSVKFSSLEDVIILVSQNDADTKRELKVLDGTFDKGKN